MYSKKPTLFIVAMFIGLCVGTPVDITGASGLVSRDGIYLPSCGCFNDCLIECSKGGNCNCPKNCDPKYECKCGCTNDCIRNCPYGETCICTLQCDAKYACPTYM
ncbi:hypothetical protein P167DRAFT_292936 [Morchella conica CCBAS932]|uniref:Uncharacterized protein n=1 Tax=Morchella conica CCBAS932 TaxID=1392247 RepID=A0A3N4KMX7_9PEZI|nr:hypothetical protein P167DRAFT_292936 [Morchella conica CCBAS932]